MMAFVGRYIYRQLADKEFNHSTILALLAPDGRIIAKRNSTGAPEPQFVAAVREALAHSSHKGTR